MGLLDGILGSVVNAAVGGDNGQAGQNPLGSILAGLTGGNQAQGSGVLGAVLGMVQRHGGLDGIVGMLRQNGLGEQVDSWVGTGANKAVGAAQLSDALGAGNIGKLAAQLGVSEGDAGGTLAKMLPELINQFTPDGKLPAGSGDLLKQALAALGGGNR